MYNVAIVQDSKAIMLSENVDLNFAVALCGSIFERAKCPCELKIIDSKNDSTVVLWTK